MGWHRTKWRRKHETLTLWLTWLHDSGAQIWQGRPFPTDPKRHVYRVVSHGEVDRDFSFLTEAKRYGAGQDHKHGVMKRLLEEQAQAKLEAQVATLTQAWQPIETAPKDGSQFLGASKHKSYGWLIEKARFYDEDKHGNRAPYAVMDGGGSPTHWQSLPAPPAGEMK